MGTNEQVRLKDYDEGRDYKLLCSWWASHGTVSARRQDLASGKGLVYFEGKEPVGACFLFITGTMAFIEAMVIAPDSSVARSRSISNMLFTSLKMAATIRGVSRLIAFVESTGMVRECKRSGFKQVGPVMAQMVQEI